MSATIFILDVAVGKANGPGDIDVVTLPGLRLPRRVYGRLQELARQWDVPSSSAAEMLLLRAINDAAGLRKRRSK